MWRLFGVHQPLFLDRTKKVGLRAPCRRVEVTSLVQAVKRLVNREVTGAGVITVFHARRVLPLMRRERSLDEMVPCVSLNGTMLRSEELSNDIIRKHMKLVLGSAPDDITLDIHPPMRPRFGFIEIVSACPPFLLCVGISSSDSWLGGHRSGSVSFPTAVLLFPRTRLDARRTGLMPLR